MKRGFVYIMANGRNGTLYIGVTSDDDLQQARSRELQMKKWKRLWKLSTIEQFNPDWRDLYPMLI